MYIIWLSVLDCLLAGPAGGWWVDMGFIWWGTAEWGHRTWNQGLGKEVDGGGGRCMID